MYLIQNKKIGPTMQSPEALENTPFKVYILYQSILYQNIKFKQMYGVGKHTEIKRQRYIQK